MDCARFFELAGRFLEELPAASPATKEWAEFEGHMRSCQACRVAWEEALEARRLLEAASRVESRPPARVRAAVLRTAKVTLGRSSRGRIRPARGLKRLLYYAAVPAAAAAVLVIVFYGARQIPPPANKPPEKLAETKTAPVEHAIAGPTELPSNNLVQKEPPAARLSDESSPATSAEPQAQISQQVQQPDESKGQKAPHPGPSPSSQHFAYIDAVQGRVTILRAGATIWANAVAGSPLAPGDKLRTGDARARLVLSSGSIVCVNKLTTLSPKAGSPSAISLLGGEIYVETVPADKGLAIETIHGRLRALGTKFGVTCGALGTKVFVAEGEVEASSNVGKALVPAGFEVALLRVDLPPGRVQKAASLEQRLAWAVGEHVVPNAARLVVWDGDEHHTAGFWVVPEGGTNWAKLRPDDSRGRGNVLEFHGEGSGYIGMGCNWRSWSRQRGTDVTGYRELTFWIKAEGHSRPEQLRIGLSSKGMKYTRQVELRRYAPNALSGDWHKVTIPLKDLAEGSEFDASSAWEIQFNTWSADVREWTLLIDEIAFEGR